MKLKISKVMLKEIKNYFKTKKGFEKYDFDFMEMNINQYSNYVDYNVFDNEIDFDCSKNVFKTIRVAYPNDYYACDKYLTTNDLVKCYKNSDKTFNGFMQSLANEIEC